MSLHPPDRLWEFGEHQGRAGNRAEVALAAVSGQQLPALRLGHCLAPLEGLSWRVSHTAGDWTESDV